MNIAKIREKYPQYDDLSDAQVAEGFHKKFYSDIPKDQFMQKIGISVESQSIQKEKAEPAKDLAEIGYAPELNELSMSSFKTALGLLTTGDTDSLKGIFKQNFGDDVSFSETEDGRPIVNLPSGQYEMNKEGVSPQDIIRGAFQGLSFFPAGKATSIPKAFAANAGTQVAIDATEGALGGEGVNADETITAGAIGGGFHAAGDIIGATYRSMKGQASPAARELIEAGKESGVKVLTSDVIPPKNFVAKNLQQTAEKIPVIGTGEVRQVQEAARVKAVDDVLKDYAIPSYDEIVTSLKSQKSKIKTAAGNVLNNASKVIDESGAINTQSTKEAVTKAKDLLSAKTVLNSDSALANLTKVEEALSEPLSFTQLKELRTGFREIVEAVDVSGKSQLPSRAKALMNNVKQSMTDDMTSAAKQSLSKDRFVKWQKANAVYAQEARELTKSKLKSVLDSGDITPEKVSTMIFSKNKSEVNLLYKSLGAEGKSNVRSAVIHKVVNTLQGRASGITPSSFASEMKKMDLQVETFFKGKDKRQLQGLIKLLDNTRRAGDAAVATPTGQTLWGAIFAGGAITNPQATATGAVTVSAIARGYESPVVRNALLKLGSLPKGSTRFESIVSELRAELNAIAQTAKIEDQ